MNKTNKGYTLTELLVAMAILSVVILSIIAIMRSSSVTYKNALFDVEVQEDAQLVCNQLEELFCDADSINFNPSENVYSVSKGSEGTYSVKFDDTTNQLVVKKDAGAYHTICDNVVAFTIAGWKQDDDNKATFKITINNNGKESIAIRDIFFRNEVENNTFHSAEVMYAGSTSSPVPAGSVAGMECNRFASYNVSMMYGIRSDFALSSSASSYFDVVTSDDPLTVNPSDHSYTIKPNNNMNYNFNLESTDAWYFTGKDDLGGDVKIGLTVKKVAIPTIDGSYTGYYIDHDERSANNGYYTIVEMDGIDVAKGLSTSDSVEPSKKVLVAKYSLDMKDKNGAKKGSTLSSNLNVVNLEQCTDGNSCFKFNGNEVAIGMFADVNDNGLLLVSANPTLSSKASGLMGFDNSNIGMTISGTVSFYKKDGSTSLGSYPVNFKYRASTNKLN